jgi:hypothetical protein
MEALGHCCKPFTGVDFGRNKIIYHETAVHILLVQLTVVKIS